MSVSLLMGSAPARASAPLSTWVSVFGVDGDGQLPFYGRLRLIVTSNQDGAPAPDGLLVVTLDGVEVSRYAATALTADVDVPTPALQLGPHVFTVEVSTSDGSSASSSTTVTIVRGMATFTDPASATTPVWTPYWGQGLFQRGAVGEVVVKEGATELLRVPATQQPFPFPLLLPGEHDVTLEYAGEPRLAPGLRALHITVNPWPTRLTLTNDHATPQSGPRYASSFPGENVTVQATVVPDPGQDRLPQPPRPMSEGSVVFREDGQTLATVPVVAGQASVVLGGHTVGFHSVTAEYTGSSYFQANYGLDLVSHVWPSGPSRDYTTVGAIDSVKVGVGTITATGWDLDEYDAAPLRAFLQVDLQDTSVLADGDRPDIAAAYPYYGRKHGFTMSLKVAPGTHQVCVDGALRGSGGIPLGPCRTVSVSATPVGSLDAVTPVSGGVQVNGWAIDPAMDGAGAVHVYVDNKGTPLHADLTRNDIGAALPASGPAHGFAVRLGAAPGPHTVCAYAIASTTGAPNTTLGCRTVMVPSGAPVGALDSAAAAGPGRVSVAGWAFDPDTQSPIDVHVYVDGAGSVLHADGGRADIAAAFPGQGPLHGFAATLTAPAGRHTVCAYGIDSIAGQPATVLGCRAVVIG